MTKIFLHPYKMASASSRVLAEALRGKRIKSDGTSKFKYSEDKLVINWGATKYNTGQIPMLNAPNAVENVSNKLKFFELIARSPLLSTVPFMFNKEEILPSVAQGSTYVARTKLKGSGGDGIVIIPAGSKTEDIPEAALYTRYIPKTCEYRVHVFCGEVIRVQKKILRPELSSRLKDENDEFSKKDVNWKVRSHDNGFIFVTGGVDEDCPNMVVEQARLVLSVVGLHFGAVDIIWNATKDKAFVLEVNSAPGLEGETVGVYADAIRKYVEVNGATITPCAPKKSKKKSIMGAAVKAEVDRLREAEVNRLREAEVNRLREAEEARRVYLNIFKAPNERIVL